MKLCLMRHGDAMSAVIDSIRPLSEKGMAEAEVAGVFLRRVGEVPDVIIHSTLLRGKLTAECVAAASGAGDVLEQWRGLEPYDSTDDFLSELQLTFGASERNILVVGHQPFISEFASLLLARSEAAVSLKFTTGSLCGVKSEGMGKFWTLRFHITSKHLLGLIQLD
ncbi:MAG: phosphohistidine phosphatase SixA [Synergistaceae bacterium]|jgi:phosphohistidine phosphatase SixA|nr:phosphohistidine phosphatase SixA [Synergistaceae bacterium]